VGEKQTNIEGRHAKANKKVKRRETNECMKKRRKGRKREYW
jgi:hypothetical protein